MEVERLLKPELQYELRVRGKSWDFGVDELRKRVRKVFSKENSGSRTYTRYVPNYSDELTGIEGILDTLADIDLVTANEKRVSSIYLHVYYRLRYLTNYEEVEREDKDRALLALRRLNDLREKIQEVLPHSMQDLPRLSYAPDESARLIVGPPPAVFDVTGFLVDVPPVQNSLFEEHVPLRSRDNLIDDLDGDEARALPDFDPLGYRPRISTVRFSEVLPNFQSTPLSVRQVNANTRPETGEPNMVRDRARSLLDNVNLQNEIERLRMQMTLLQTKLSNQSNSQPTHITYSAPIVKSGEVHKWNLHFSGNKSESVFGFLESVKDKAQSRNVDDALLFKCASDLFTGSALVWFRSGLERGVFSTWSQLVVHLKRTFLPEDWEDILMDEIKCRRQGADESIEIYVACISKMFSRLTSPPSQLAQLKIMWKNLHLFYLERIELLSLNTIEDLLAKGRVIEYARQVTESRRNAESKPNLIDPDLAYKGISKSRKPDPKVAVVETSKEDPKSGKMSMCWNCRKLSSHMGRDCPEVRSKYCYKCGHQGVTTKECPKCSKN